MSAKCATPPWPELSARLPAALRPYALELSWDAARLRALPLPVEEMRVTELAWQLALPWWRDGRRFFAVSPLDVLARPDRFAEQYERTLAADLAFPLDVTPRAGRLVVLDGLHRLLKAVIHGRETVDVRVFRPVRLPQIAVPGSIAHDFDFVRAVLTLLDAQRVRCWLFGGWAEELRGLSPPRPHSDVDLLYPAEDFRDVDRAIALCGLEEVEAKRFVHKRAFMLAGVLVELFLVRRDAGGLHTVFDGVRRFAWPADALLAGGPRVASAEALEAFRAAYPA